MHFLCAKPPHGWSFLFAKVMQFFLARREHLPFKPDPDRPITDPTAIAGTLMHRSVGLRMIRRAFARTVSGLTPTRSQAWRCQIL
jgi:hypothetical protein